MRLSPQPDSLNEIPGYTPAVPLVEVCRANVAVPEERLNLVGWNTLLVQVGGDGHPERVGRDSNTDFSPFRVASHHLVDVVPDHRGLRELAGPSGGGAEEMERLPFPSLRVPGPLLLREAAPLQVLVEEHLEVMGDGDFPRLAPLLVEVEHPLLGGLIKVVPLEGGDGSDPRPV